MFLIPLLAMVALGLLVLFVVLVAGAIVGGSIGAAVGGDCRWSSPGHGQGRPPSGGLWRRAPGTARRGRGRFAGSLDRTGYRRTGIAALLLPAKKLHLTAGAKSVLSFPPVVLPPHGFVLAGPSHEHRDVHSAGSSPLRCNPVSCDGFCAKPPGPFGITPGSSGQADAPQPTIAAELRVCPGTVEPDGLALLTRLVKRSHQLPGPIVEIGTLFGRTATHMALVKAPQQKIITVDTYTWNPWGLSCETHYQLTSRILYYLVQTATLCNTNEQNRFYATYRGPAPAWCFSTRSTATGRRRKTSCGPSLWARP